MLQLLWILHNRKPVPTNDARAWAALLGDIGSRRVALDVIEQPEHDPVTVSTVFLGLDHNWSGGPPLLFESKVFGGPLDGDTYRYCTWDEAEAGHRMLTDEAVVEGKVSAWEVREQLKALAAESRA